jgi:hypothetical protein
MWLSMMAACRSKIRGPISPLSMSGQFRRAALAAAVSFSTKAG